MASNRVEEGNPTAPYDFVVRTSEGDETTLDSYRGRVLLIVNVASQCGFTPQYEGLESLYQSYRDGGFAVLAFPCNQFAGQEPGTDSEIRSFCASRYQVTFPLFSKIEVNGSEAHPLYRWLKAQAPGVLGTQSIKWNFTKFLVDRSGRVVERFGPSATPASIEAHVRSLVESTTP
jgi:glutathione peroxidase